jgi:hypothetical protein
MTIVISFYNPYTSIQLFAFGLAYQISLHGWNGFKVAAEIAELKFTVGFVSLGIREI